MTPQRKQLLKRLGSLIAVLLPALGWGLSRADMRYVHADAYLLERAKDSLQTAAHAQRDSIKDWIINTKLDDIGLRVQQIQCGDRIARGCR